MFSNGIAENFNNFKNLAHLEELFEKRLAGLLLDLSDKSLAMRSRGYHTYSKADGSVVTSVDFFVDDFLKGELPRIFSNVPIVSEENSEDENEDIMRSTTKDYFVVDPIDGTYSFVRNGDYCINIAYMINGMPMLGAIAIPTKGEVFFTGIDGKVRKKTRTGIVTMYPPEVSESQRSYDMIANKRHVLCGDKLVSSQTIMEELNANGFEINSSRTAIAAIKYCVFLENVADFVISFGRVASWDIAASYALLAKFDVGLVDEYGRSVTFENDRDSELVLACKEGSLREAILSAYWRQYEYKEEDGEIVY